MNVIGNHSVEHLEHMRISSPSLPYLLESSTKSDTSPPPQLRKTYIYISHTHIFIYIEKRFCYLQLFTPSFLHFRHINLYTRPAFTSYCDFPLHQNTICPHLTSLTRCCTETSLPTSVTDAVVSLAPTTGKNIYFFNLDSSPGCKGCKRN